MNCDSENLFSGFFSLCGLYIVVDGLLFFFPCVCMCRYVRILGAFYLRLTGIDVDVYRYLEPLYNDYRKLRLKLGDGRMFPGFFPIFYFSSCLFSFCCSILYSLLSGI